MVDLSATRQSGPGLVSRRSKLLLLIVVSLLAIFFFSVPAPAKQLSAQRLLQNSPFATPYTFQGQAVLPDAHRLKDADDFLPHFKAVVQYPAQLIQQTRAGCWWPDEDTVNLQFQYDATRGKDFDWILNDEDDAKIDAVRKQWQYFVSNEMKPWSEHRHKYSGRGIVIPAGHMNSIYRTKVILRMLNKLGSTLPVEMAHWGGELTAESKQELLEIRSNLFFNDLSKGQSFNTWYRAMMNFQLKIPSILNSRFAEIILMDSDNIPTMDPAVLFDSETYKEYGTIFWPDIARTRPQNPIWAISNQICRTDEWEFESGQLVIDKRKFFYHLQLATWLETENQLYYGTLVLGDKDMFRFAWHMLRTKFGVPSRWVTSVGSISPGSRPSEKEVYCGHTFAQHHPDVNGSVAFLHGGLLKTLKWEVLAYHLKHNGGIFQVYKRTIDDQDKKATPRVKVNWDLAPYIPDADKSPEFGPAWCTDFPLTAHRPLEELLPGFEQTYTELGGYWLLDVTEKEEYKDFSRLPS